jgi:hypothetical protein
VQTRREYQKPDREGGHPIKHLREILEAILTEQTTPAEWGHDSLSSFIELANRNTYGVFVLYNKWFSLLQHIDSAFDKFSENLLNLPLVVEPLLFMRGQSAYRAAVRLATSGQIPEAYSLLRGCLEYSLYGFYLYRHPTVVETWLGRNKGNDEKKKAQNELRPAKMLGELEKADASVGKIARLLYEFTIDVGAHPNPKAITYALEHSQTEERMSFVLLQLDVNHSSMILGLKTIAQVGLCTLKTFRLVFPERFDLLGITENIQSLSRTTVDGIAL